MSSHPSIIYREQAEYPRLHYGYGLKFLKADYIKRKSRRKISKMGHMSKIYTKKIFCIKSFPSKVVLDYNRLECSKVGKG